MQTITNKATLAITAIALILGALGGYAIGANRSSTSPCGDLVSTAREWLATNSSPVNSPTHVELPVDYQSNVLSAIEKCNA